MADYTRFIYTNETNVVSPSVEPTEEPTQSSATILNDNGVEQDHGDDPVWGTTNLSLTLAPAEVAVSAKDEVWTIRWDWQVSDLSWHSVTDTYQVATRGDIGASVAEIGLTIGTNTYVDLDDASSYFAGRLKTEAWDDANEIERASALIMAARSIGMMRFRGRPVDDDQALAFPRAYFGSGSSTYSEENERYSTYSTLKGWLVEDEVPQAVKDFQCEEALAVLNGIDSTNDRVSLQNQGVRSIRIGDFAETYAATRSVKYGSVKAVDALGLMDPYLAGSAKIV